MNNEIESQIRSMVEQIVDRLTLDPATEKTGKVVAFGSDHRGYTIKEAVIPKLAELGYEVINTGCFSADTPADYPDVASDVCSKIADGTASFGIVVDGAGIGSSIAANKVNGIRAAFCFNEMTIKNSRLHNNANVLTLGAPFHNASEAGELIELWLSTPFEGGRHNARIDKITKIERNN